MNDSTFLNDVSKTTAGFGSLNEVKVIEKTENSVTLEFSVPAGSPYFSGHFPGFPILPAVAQTELILRFASAFFGTGINVSEIKRIKFSGIFKPDILHRLQLGKNEKTISFKIVSLDEKTVFSSGVFVLNLD